MNYLLTVVLLLAILIFASGIYRIERERASYDANTEHPENLRFILKKMLRTVQTGGQWDRLESMRDEVRQALLDLALVLFDPALSLPLEGLQNRHPLASK